MMKCLACLYVAITILTGNLAEATPCELHSTRLYIVVSVTSFFGDQHKHRRSRITTDLDNQGPLMRKS